MDELAEKIKALSLPEKLILAAELLKEGRGRLATTIAGGVVDELRLMQLTSDMERRT